MPITATTRKLLKQLGTALVGQPVQGITVSSIGGRTAAIPDDLRTGPEDLSSLTLTGLRYTLYSASYRALARDSKFESMSPEELDVALWRFACEISLRQDLYSDQTRRAQRITSLLETLSLPLLEWNVIISIAHLKVLDGPISVGRIKFLQWDTQSARSWGMPPHDPPSPFTEQFLTTACASLSVSSGSRDGALRLAIIEVDKAIEFLKVGMLKSRFITVDELLLQKRTGYYAIKMSDGSPEVYYGAQRGFRPIELEIHSGLRTSLERDLPQLQAVLNGEFKGDLGERLVRAVEWIGTSVTRENYDDKIIDLCTSLECLLTTIAEGRKAEVVALRALLLGYTIASTYYDLIPVYKLYLLRNRIVHGSARYIAGPMDCANLRLVAVDVLGWCVQLIRRQPAIRSVVDVTRAIEHERPLRHALDQIDGAPDQRDIKELRGYVQERLSGMTG
jgi:hypothetical protein